MLYGKQIWGDVLTIDDIYNIKCSLMDTSCENNKLPIMFIKIIEIINEIEFKENPNYDEIICILKNEMDNQNNIYGKEQNIQLFNNIILNNKTI
jgi:hypothetical protein